MIFLVSKSSSKKPGLFVTKESVSAVGTKEGWRGWKFHPDCETFKFAKETSIFGTSIACEGS
jgi:hypothetical protein